MLGLESINSGCLPLLGSDKRATQLSGFFILKESHTLVFGLKAWQNTSKIFPVESFRNMSRAHNKAKLLFLV
jgi:hypothetical protein